ncbi:MAG: thioredoxin family protein [Spartobacteria bacterium]
MKFTHSLVSWLSIGLLCIACGEKKSSPVVEAPVTEQKPPADEELHWLTDYEAAKAQARSENKMLLMLFTGSDWCPPCIMLHRQVFSQPEFADYAAKNLVLLEVDFPRTKELSAEQKTANEKLANRFGIYGFPTVVVLDQSGKKLGDLGYMPGGPKEFIAALKKLQNKS